MDRLVIALVALLSGFSAYASDHIDGVPSLTKHQQVDLTDLYAFPTPGKDQNLTVILNLYPGVPKSGHFSAKVSYEIFINPLEISSVPLLPQFMVDKEQGIKILCQFTDPSHHGGSHGHEGTGACALQAGAQSVTTKTTVNKTSTDSNHILKLFVGHRADPFFITAEHFSAVTERKGFPDRQKISEVSGLNAMILMKGNLMEGLNVLSIAMEIDLAKIAPELSEQPIGIAAQSFTSESGVKEILDRVGRPEITNLSLHDISGKNPLKPKYNSMGVFFLSPFATDVAAQTYFSELRVRLVDNISAYDKLDNVIDWTDLNKLQNLSNILLDDYLVVDLSKPCVNSNVAVTNYFAIELALLKGSKHGSCGGRQLTDDIMATLYALYIGGVNGLLINYQTGIFAPYASSDTALKSEFPYMADPWTMQWPQKKLLLDVGKKNQE